jgi:hypothetical protein
MQEPIRRPLYARVLRLRHLRAGGVACFLLFEGVIAAAGVLALVGVVSWWAVPVLPVAVAAMVKLNDVVAGRLHASAGRGADAGRPERLATPHAPADTARSRSAGEVARAEAGPAPSSGGAEAPAGSDPVAGSRAGTSGPAQAGAVPAGGTGPDDRQNGGPDRTDSLSSGATRAGGTAPADGAPAGGAAISGADRSAGLIGGSGGLINGGEVAAHDPDGVGRRREAGGGPGGSIGAGQRGAKGAGAPAPDPAAASTTAAAGTGSGDALEEFLSEIQDDGQPLRPGKAREPKSWTGAPIELGLGEPVDIPPDRGIREGRPHRDKHG